MHVNTAHTFIVEDPSLLTDEPSHSRIKKRVLEDLYPTATLRKWRKINLYKYQRKFRIKRDISNENTMIDPMELDFQELRTKIRDKRKIIELSKLEKDYAKCKQESISHSECMETFVKMYKIARDISEKMEKMKQIFRDSEVHLHASSVSASMEKYIDTKKSSKHQKKYEAHAEDSSWEVKKYESTLKPTFQTEESIEDDVLDQTTESVKRGMKKLINTNNEELIPPEEVWVQEDKLPHLDTKSDDATQVFESRSDATTESFHTISEDDTLNQTTTKEVTPGMKKLIETDGDDLIPSADVWVDESNVPHLDTKTDNIPIILNTTSFDESQNFETSSIPSMTEIPFSNEKADEINFNTLTTISDFDGLEITTDTMDSFKVDPLDVTTQSFVDISDANTDSFYTEAEEKVSRVTEFEQTTTEAARRGLKKLMKTDGNNLIPSIDVWVKVDDLPHHDGKSADIIPVTLEVSVNETDFDFSQISSTINPSTDKITTESFSEDYVEPMTKIIEEMDFDFVTSKPTEITETPLNLHDESDKTPIPDLDFTALNDNLTVTTESFHTVSEDVINEEKISDITEPMFDVLDQTTEAVKRVLKKLIMAEGDELIPPTNVFVEEDELPHEDEKSVDILPVIFETPVNETDFEITLNPSTTDGIEILIDTESSSTESLISSEPAEIEETTDTLDNFKIDPLDMITIKNQNTTTEEFSEDYVEPMSNHFDMDSVTSNTTTVQFNESPDQNEDPIIPEERSRDILRLGIKTILSNYTTDVEFTYSGKCIGTSSTTTRTISNTTPSNNLTEEDCKTHDPSTEGPLIVTIPSQERKPTEELTTTTISSSKSSKSKEHPLDDPSSKENMLDDQDDNNYSKVPTTTASTLIENVWKQKFKEGSHDPGENLDENTNTSSELIETFGELDIHKFGPKMNPSKMANRGNNKQLLTLCDYLAKQTRSKVTSNPEQQQQQQQMDDITPSPNIQFTSRGPGFPVTGETMKASAQFFINPNFGMPSIPVCFYITPASFRMMMQPFWSPFFGMHGMGGGSGSGGNSGNSGSGGVFIIPPSFGNMQNSGNFFGQTSPSGSGSQGNIPNIFSKSASNQQQQKQQQFFCTYMQNGGKQSGSVGNRGFNNINFKLRNSSGNVSSPSDIIYSSYWNKLPGYHGSNLGEEDRFQCPIEGDVPCYGGNECVPEKKWCDSTVDCSDGSDEAACTCRKRILESRICDGYQDCPLGEDEIGCFGCENFMYSCYDNEEEFQRANRSTLAMCYSAAERCDGVRNCINGRDEMGCNLIVGDLTHHMSHAVSGSTGYLYRNYHGEWYPVCNNGQRWAREACSEELGVLAEEPLVTFQEVELPGPFIESHHSGGAHFSQSCQKRERDMLSDITSHVRCPQAKCGIIQELTSPLMRSRRRRRRRSEPNLAEAGRIVGGDFSKPLQWPFVVAVYRNGDFHCGGTIFDEQWIITAAHCTIHYHKYFYEVRAGMLRRSSFSSSTQIHHVTHVVVHQMYERRTMKNDLALMRIDTPLRFNRWVKPICLPDIGRTTMGTDWIWGPEVNTICTVVGWGAVREKGPGSDRLKEVQLPIRRRCTEKDDQEAEDICAGEAAGGRDACQGDSGGPLFCRSVSNNNEWYLAGVVSHGNGCARVKEFGVYTRVALYLDWIAMAMKSEFLPKVQPKQLCPGYVCIWGGKRCIPQSKRCDRLVDCLGGEDEVGCIYNYIPDVGASAAGAGAGDGTGRNASTTPVMDEADQDGAATTETDGVVDGKHFNGATDTEPSSFEIPNGNIAIASTDDATTHSQSESDSDSPSTLLAETISEKVETIVDFTPTMPTMTSPPTATPPEPITELNPSSSSFSPLPLPLHSPSPSPPTSLADQSKLKDLAVKFLDTIELQIASTSATTSPTEGWDADTTNTTPLTTATGIGSSSIRSVTSITGFGDFKADLMGESSSENPTAVQKRENATENETPTMMKQLKTMPKKIAQKFVCEKIPQIIDISNRCDRIADCEDGTDEDGCTCRQYLKGPLNILICDGKIDCDDFTDEDDCGNCTANQFLCPMSKTCIDSTSRCDEIVDCQFKEDEKDCFALTNGREIHLDSHKIPKLQSSGIFSRNLKGQWRVVCSHETQYHQHVAKTADEVCSLLGFKGSLFHNTTEITPHTIVPIDPDLALMGMPLPTDRHAVGDSGHFTKHFSYNLNIPHQPSSPRTERLGKSTMSNCQGLYIECVTKSNETSPMKTLIAGNEINTKTLNIPESFKPNKKTITSISELFSDKKDEILDKLNKLIETKKTVLVHDKLHEGVEKIHWPWLVGVYVNGELWCIGVLVDKHWVLVHESCYIGVSLDTDFVTVLLGGGKSKQTLHKSPHEQIKRVDCFDTVDNSDVMLLHLDNAAHFTRHVLPTFLPDMILTEKDKGKTSNKCMSVVHDKFGGIKVTPTMEKLEATMCSKNNELLCYQWDWDPKAILDFKLKHFGNDQDNEREEKVSLSSSTRTTKTTPLPLDRDEEAKSLLDFCKDIEDNINSYNQGVIVCREENTGWYPMAYYTFNATECSNNLNQPFAVRTLDKVYGFIQEIIDQPKCMNSDPKPRPHCPGLRCPLGNCLLPDQMCNGKVDCHDGSDEEKENCRLHRNECKASELKCRSNGKCIPKTKFCDNISDCEDLTDEPSICSCFTYLQATDPSKICDGIRNCWDKSDESSVLCNCTSDRFPCGSSRSECIPRDFVCDKEPDCPNGEDERYCYGIEQPIKTYSSKAQPSAYPSSSSFTSGYGQVTEQSYGIWHTKCFPRQRPPDSDEVSEICRKLGYHSRRPPSYRLIDDNADIVAATHVENGGFTKSPGKYRDATKAVVINKFSPLHLNEDLTLIMKPSRPIAQLVKWNQTDSKNCYRLEVKCN
ncbi:serine protease nudel [Eupeodes corollae]|uniref:serine protease nudel n=1 Tax=Eupeodes corollae TaxID=290404 RepID=UPI0024932E3D|nr:serine protease nudel [Eupeodes corollae]